MTKKRAKSIFLSLKEKKAIVDRIDKFRTKRKGISIKKACEKYQLHGTRYYSYVKQLTKANLIEARPARKYAKRDLVTTPTTTIPDENFLQVPAEQSRPLAVIIGNKEDLVEVFGAMKSALRGQL